MPPSRTLSIASQGNRGTKQNDLNDNFHKRQFQKLCHKIKRRAACSVSFDYADALLRANEILAQ
jgi:hypothetical protein